MKKQWVTSRLNRSNLLKWIAIASILVIIFIIIKPGQETDYALQQSEEKERNPLVISNPRLMEFKNDHVTLKLISEYAEIFEKKNLTRLFDVRMNIFSDKNPGKQTLIRANRGEFHKKSNMVSIEGNVNVTFEDGQKLQTDELHLDREKKLLFSHTEVIINSKMGTLHGKSFSYEIDSGIMKLKKPVMRIAL